MNFLRWFENRHGKFWLFTTVTSKTIENHHKKSFRTIVKSDFFNSRLIVFFAKIWIISSWNHNLMCFLSSFGDSCRSISLPITSITSWSYTAILNFYDRFIDQHSYTIFHVNTIMNTKVYLQPQSIHILSSSKQCREKISWWSPS